MKALELTDARTERMVKREKIGCKGVKTIAGETDEWAERGEGRIERENAKWH